MSMKMTSNGEAGGIRKYSLDAELASGYKKPPERRAQTLPNITQFDKSSSRSGGDFVLDELTARNESIYKGMSKTHYVEKSSRDRCLNCIKTFSLKNRPKHCRRCGDVFCIKCLQNKLHLNASAIPDPAGKLRKVCRQCFLCDSFEEGASRCLTTFFSHERQRSKVESVSQMTFKSFVRHNSIETKVDILVECRRLLLGFEKVVRKSGYRKTLEEAMGHVTASSWQISPNWEEDLVYDSCRVCKGSLGLRKSMRSCKVCGIPLCRTCSFKELLLFYDDVSFKYNVTTSDLSSRRLTSGPRLAIINIVGCPDTEPRVSLLLHMCWSCKSFIAAKQARDRNCFCLSDNQEFWDCLVTVDTSLTNLQTVVMAGLAEYSDILAKDTTVKASEILARVRLSLMDFECHFRKLKTLQPTTVSQKTLKDNFTKCKNNIYLDNRIRYMRMCRRQGERHTCDVK